MNLEKKTEEVCIVCGKTQTDHYKGMAFYEKDGEIKECEKYTPKPFRSIYPYCHE